MRLLLNVRATLDFIYDSNYYHKIQGFVYDLMADIPYSSLHEKKGYKFFCFSNIFPIKKDLIIKKDELKNFLISSPDRGLILSLKEKFNKIKDEDKQISIGNMIFKVENIKILNLNLKKRNLKLRSATPIIIRIPEKNYKKYGIPLHARKKRFLYWRPEYSFDIFVKQLEENLIKKYKEFYNEDIQDTIFEMFKFIKGPLVNKVIIHGKEYPFVGSIWEFEFSYLNKEKRKILKFGIDCGFGERNSLGFGFINIIGC